MEFYLKERHELSWMNCLHKKQNDTLNNNIKILPIRKILYFTYSLNFLHSHIAYS